MALNSEIMNKLIYRNWYQMPNIIELVEKVMLMNSGNTFVPFWFSYIDLKYTYSQKPLSEKTSRHCNFSIFGG